MTRLILRLQERGMVLSSLGLSPPPPTISAVRSFNGTNDAIIMSAGGLVGWNGAGTWAGLLKRTATTERTFSTVRNAAHSPLYTGSDFEAGVSDYITDAGFTTVGQALPANVWCLVVVTKADGSAIPRWHVYRFDTQLWTHANFGAAMANNTALASDGEVCFGNFNGSLWWQGFGAASGFYSNVPDDATIEAAGLQTALANWLTFGTPLAVWGFNQADATDTISDLTGGGADQMSSTNPAVETVDLPAGFSF